jgi:Acyl-CoA dehydrogenase, N-terminal domain
MSTVLDTTRTQAFAEQALDVRLRCGGCACDTVVAANRRFHGPHVCQPCRGRREHCRCRTRRRIRHCEARRDDGANRRLAPPVIDALPAAGLFGLFTPRAPGGLEIDPVTFARVVEEVSTFDSAAGRAFQINTGAWWTSRMSAEGVAELYADGPDRRHSLLPSGLKKCRVATESPGAVRWRAPSMIHVGR